MAPEKKVLLLEDEDFLSKAIITRLEQSGYEVLHAPTGEEARALFDEHHASINFVWLDYYLPKIDGLEFLEELNKDYESVPPVFVVSNTASAEIMEKLLQAGAVETFIKSENRLDSIIRYIEASI